MDTSNTDEEKTIEFPGFGDLKSQVYDSFKAHFVESVFEATKKMSPDCFIGTENLFVEAHKAILMSASSPLKVNKNFD